MDDVETAALIDLRPAVDAFGGLVRGLAPSQPLLATPCEEYAVGDLIDHVAIVVTGAIALARAEPAPPTRDVSGEQLGADWQERLLADLDGLAQLWSDPAVWARPGTPFSNETWGKIVLTELVVHGWDLAVATGQTLVLPEEALEACFEHVAEFVPQAPFPELWGTAVDVPADAPLLDRILGITGRTPR